LTKDCSNRTIVGLKRHACVNKLREIDSSNRTIVGLKQHGWRNIERSHNLQQSHHCGIETAPTHFLVGVAVNAAIAPLWD